MPLAESRAREILNVLRKTFTLPGWVSSDKDPFTTLIIGVISQNTSDRNAIKAFENLSRSFQITPQALADAEVEKIEECLKVAGLYRSKAKIIKRVSRIILDKFSGSLEPILLSRLETARETLLQLPGVGPKTADVVLLFSANKPTIPVDTHVNRVSKRLCLAPADGGYEAIRESLQALYEPEDYLDLHVLLIILGRRYCKARNPLCKECPVNALCPSKQ